MTQVIAHLLRPAGLLLALSVLIWPITAISQEATETISPVQDNTSVTDPFETRLSAAEGEEYRIFLPVIAQTSFAIIAGTIKLYDELDDAEGPSRIKGLTFFDSLLHPELDVSNLHFTFEPDAIWACPSDITPCNSDGTSRKKSDPIPFEMGPRTPGVHNVTVYFQHGTSPILERDFTFFYIPDGDFNSAFEFDDPDEDETLPWTRTTFAPNHSKIPDKTEAVTVSEGQLILRPHQPSPACDKAFRSRVTAEITLELPPDSDYKLHVKGTVITQDLNPSDTATFDAFEILMNNHVVARYSNQEAPIRCDNLIYRQVPFEAQIPLSNYSGPTVLSLENHLRYDDYFDTYTEIEMVWIDR